MTTLGLAALVGGIVLIVLIAAVFVLAVIGSRRDYQWSASFRWAPAPKPKAQASASEPAVKAMPERRAS